MEQPMSSPPSADPTTPSTKPCTITIVHCWSAPRSRSTALLYSFESRNNGGKNVNNGNTIALDEPLYRRWLQEKIQGSSNESANYGISRPYADAFLKGVAPPESESGEIWRWEREKQCCNERVYHAVKELLDRHGNAGGGAGGGVIFLKQMAKFSHLFDFATNWETETHIDKKSEEDEISDIKNEARYWKNKCLELVIETKKKFNVQLKHRHVLLIRDPLSVLSSWMGKSGSVHGNNPHPDEVGIVQLLDVYSKVMGANMNSEPNQSGDITQNESGCDVSSEVIVIDSDDLAANPRQSLQELCKALDIDYCESMLHWKSGSHECDGPWAKWWYHDVWESTGWDVDAEDTDGNSVTKNGAEGDVEMEENSKHAGDKRKLEGKESDIVAIKKNDRGIHHPRTKRYRTVPPSLLPILRMSNPAYQFLETLTSSYKQRAVSAPPSRKLYEDPRNEHVLVYVGTPAPPTTSSSSASHNNRARFRIIPRNQASISPFDSSVQGGDATWEGIRIYNGRIFHLDRHLHRLFCSAQALGFENIHTKDEVVEAIFRVLAANGMRDGAHMRLTLTRGEKCTSSMNPKFNVYGTTLIILPEWKPTEGATTYDNTKGISLITAGTCRRSPPSTLDNKIHHNNMIQNILPKIQANNAGAADSIMLDVEGFVSETNATNLFLVRYDVSVAMNGGPSFTGDNDSGVKRATLVTPSADHCLPGITRETVLLLAKELEMKVEEKRVSLSEFYCADEVFTTGTMGELTPVTDIDGRKIGISVSVGGKTSVGGGRGPVTAKLQQVYKNAIATRLDWSTEIPTFS